MRNAKLYRRAVVRLNLISRASKSNKIPLIFLRWLLTNQRIYFEGEVVGAGLKPAR